MALTFDISVGLIKEIFFLLLLSAISLEICEIFITRLYNFEKNELLMIDW